MASKRIFLILLLFVFVVFIPSHAGAVQIKWTYPVGGNVNQIAMPSDSSYIVVASTNGNISAINATGTLLWQHHIGGNVPTLAMTSDGSGIVAGSDDSNIYFFNRDGIQIWAYPVNYPVSKIAISADGSIIAAGGSEDGFWYYQRMYLLDRDGNLIHSERPSASGSGSNGIWDVTVSPDGNLIALGTEEWNAGGGVHLYNRTGGKLWTYNPGDDVRDVDISPDGSRITAAVGYYAGGKVLLFDNRGTLLWNSPTAGYSAGVAISNDKSYITSADIDFGHGHITLFDQNGNQLWSREQSPFLAYPNQVGNDYRVEQSEDNERITAGHEDFVFQYDLDGDLLWSLDLDPGLTSGFGISDIAVSPDGSVVAAGSRDPGLLYDLALSVERGPPRLNRTNPADGETGVNTGANITFIFDRTIVPGSAFNSISLIGSAGGTMVPIDVTVDGRMVVLNPRSKLEGNTSYSATVPAAAVNSKGGNYPLDIPYSFEFKTGFIVESFTEMNITETISARSGSLSGGTVTGDLSGTVAFPTLQTVTVAGGAFASQGSINGTWTATLEGRACSGTWQGMVVPEDGHVRLRGTIVGPGERGTFDGFLNETVVGSGVYDRYHATWTMDRLGGVGASASLTVDGTLNLGNSISYPNTPLQITQELVAGTVAGDYHEPINAMMTCVRIVDAASPYYGSGFMYISYTSMSGGGEAWAAISGVLSSTVPVTALFTNPFAGFATGTLDESESPPRIAFSIERMDKALPPAAALSIEILGPGRISPGQTVDYVIEYGNMGLKKADDVRVTVLFEPALDIVATSAGSSEGTTNWNVSTVSSSATGKVFVRGMIPWGLPSGSQVKAQAYISSMSSNYVSLDDLPGCARTEEQDPTNEELQSMLCPAGGQCRDSWKTLYPPGSLLTNFIGTYDKEAHRTIYRQYPSGPITQQNNCDGTCTVKYVCHQRTWDDYGFLRCECDQCECEKQIELDEGLGPIPKWETTCYYTGQISFRVNSAVGHDREQLLETTVPCASNCDQPDPKDDTSTGDVIVARDPNVKYGPEGRVSAGQRLDYRIEFENEGEGTAYGVYFTDTLDADLDAATLSVGPVFSTSNNQIIASPGIYDSDTRTITWPVGEVGPHKGGYANISVNVRADAPDDTEIINYGTVYFPSVPEITKTNALVAIVGYNRPPEIEWISDKVANVTDTVMLTVNATDPDGDVLTHSVTLQNQSALPSGITFDSASGAFRWTPGVDQSGVYPLMFSVEDFRSQSIQNMTLTVVDLRGRQPVQVPGGFGIPSDTAPRDGYYEDVNGNGRKDFADVVLYFNQMSWITANEPILAFDYNGNDRIDFADVVWLFNNL